MAPTAPFRSERGLAPPPSPEQRSNMFSRFYVDSFMKIDQVWKVAVRMKLRVKIVYPRSSRFRSEPFYDDVGLSGFKENVSGSSDAALSHPVTGEMLDAPLPPAILTSQPRAG